MWSRPDGFDPISLADAAAYLKVRTESIFRWHKKGVKRFGTVVKLHCFKHDWMKCLHTTRFDLDYFMVAKSEELPVFDDLIGLGEAAAIAHSTPSQVASWCRRGWRFDGGSPLLTSWNLGGKFYTTEENVRRYCWSFRPRDVARVLIPGVKWPSGFDVACSLCGESMYEIGGKISFASCFLPFPFWGRFAWWDRDRILTPDVLLCSNCDFSESNDVSRWKWGDDNPEHLRVPLFHFETTRMYAKKYQQRIQCERTKKLCRLERKLQREVYREKTKGTRKVAGRFKELRRAISTRDHEALQSLKEELATLASSPA